MMSSHLGINWLLLAACSDLRVECPSFCHSHAAHMSHPFDLTALPFPLTTPPLPLPLLLAVHEHREAMLANVFHGLI